MPMARVATLERRANKSIMLLCGAAVNQAGHGQIALYSPVVKSILAGCSIHLPCFRRPRE
jgi:hypothetical protein